MINHVICIHNYINRQVKTCRMHRTMQCTTSEGWLLFQLFIDSLKQHPPPLMTLKRAHTWQFSGADTQGRGCCRSEGKRSFWNCGAGGWLHTGEQRHWAGMCCSKEGGCYYWFHCDSRCPCHPQHCLGLHLQRDTWRGGEKNTFWRVQGW